LLALWAGVGTAANLAAQLPALPHLQPLTLCDCGLYEADARALGVALRRLEALEEVVIEGDASDGPTAIALEAALDPLRGTRNRPRRAASVNGRSLWTG